MEGQNNTAPGQNTANQPGAAVSSKIPPPPMEVAIRTMASDIASSAAAGGGAPRAEVVQLGDHTPASGLAAHRNLFEFVLIALGVIVLAAAVYFAFF